MTSPTNADLMNAIIAVTNKQTADRILLSTLRDSHTQRVAKADRFESDMRTQVGAIKLRVSQNTRNIATMLPVVQRIRMRAVIRRAVVDCFGRWWGLLTATAMTIGGLIVWFGDHWPRVAAFLRKFGSLFAIIAALLIVSIAFARAQEHHAQHHAYYNSWVNKNDKGCCNNQDCGELREENERETATGTEVKIEGQWCPVQSWHYLKAGNAPDWSTSHVCVMKEYVAGMDVCQRLLCYQPKPGT